MTDRPYMDLNEFHDLGFLQEINREVLHPAGLAMEMYTDDEGNVTGFGGVWDYRDDPEGMFFGPGEISADKIRSVAEEQHRHAAVRRRVLGRLPDTATAVVQRRNDVLGGSDARD